MTTNLYLRLGGRAKVMALAHTFYDIMEASEEALASLHARTPEGRITQDSRERFGLFLVGWLGGPQDYMATYGHPRLRMRHMNVRVDAHMRDAWLRCMEEAMTQHQLPQDVHQLLSQRFAQVAEFMRNSPDEPA